MSTHPGWKRATQVKLIAELQGFWAEDLWDMHHSPAGTLSPNASQRRLRFDCKSAAINGELKYVCWKKFSGGEWRSTQELTKVHLMIRWLNSLNDLPASLMCLSFPEWQALYRKYLMGQGMYKPGTTNRMNGNQQPSITARDSGYISLLRQASIMLAQAYDLRPAHEKDIWDLKLMGATTNLSRTNVRLGFLIVRQEWLRDAAKLYLKYCLPLYSASTCRTRVQSLACFSNFLAEVKPQATAKHITRRLLLDYLNYLQKRVRPGCAKNNVLNLRNFLEMSHREAWLPVGPERLIYDEEVPQPPKPQPRYLPSAVLDQLNRHLDDLRAPWRQMILILQECGMRISELLELPVDCLTQDARGVHYLRYLQGKVRRENAIPVSTVIASLVQEQQATVRAGRIESALLFPNSKRRGSQAGQLRSQDQSPCLRSRHTRSGRQAVPLPGASVPSHRWNPYGQSRSSSPHHPALSRPQGSGDDEPLRPYPRRHHEGQTVGVSERHADRCLRQCGYGGWGQRHGRSAVVHSQRPGSSSDERLLRDPNRGWSVSTPERLPQLCALQDGCHVPRSASRRTARDRAGNRQGGRERMGATKRNERAKTNKPHQHRHNPGGKSWLGIPMV